MVNIEGDILTPEWRTKILTQLRDKASSAFSDELAKAKAKQIASAGFEEFKRRFNL